MLATIGKLRPALKWYQMLSGAPWRHKMESCAYTAHSENIHLLEDCLGELIYILTEWLHSRHFDTL